MRYLVRSLLVGMFVLASAAPVLSQTSPKQGAVNGWLPFSAEDDDLLTIPAAINGKPVRALVDSGVAGVLLNKTFADRERMPLTKIGTARDIGGAQSRYTTPHFQLTVDGIVGPDAPVQVSDLTRVEQASGSEIDVVIGASFIAAFGLEVDFDHHRLRFKAPDRIDSSQFRVPLKYDGREFVVSASTDGRMVGPLFLDLGSNLGIRWTASYAGIANGTRPVTDVMSAGAGGDEVAELATLPNFTLGQADFGEVELELVPGGDADRPEMAGSLGLGVLRRYNLGLDAHRGVMILTPRLQPMEKMPKNTVGVQVMPEPHRLLIKHVMKNSPAAKAGLKAGDTICSINGFAITSNWQNSPMRHWGTSAAGKEYKVNLCTGRAISIVTRIFY